jgi:single-strand DNA-binding protein
MKSNVKNSVTLVGNVGRDIQLMSFEGGNKKATCSLATTDTYRNAKGETVKQTDWHNIVAWGKTAELMAQNIKKGNEVSVSGRIASRSYVAKDGQLKYVTEIIVSDFFKIARVELPVVEAVPF